MLRNFLLLSSLVTSTLLGHSAESAGAPPADLSPALGALLQKDGIRVKDGDKIVMEFWFRTGMPPGPGSGQGNVTLAEIPHGALLGVVRYPAKGQDRRGQSVKPGVYTMRFSFYPENGDHQGAAPQRDFLILSPVGEDTNLAAMPEFEPLMELSRKGSGTPHPLVLSIWKQDPASFKPGVAPDGESDQALQTRLGETPIAVIVAGVFNH